MSSVVNIVLSQGDDTSRIWQITSNGAVVSLAGATVVARIKASQTVADDAAGVHTLTVGSGLTVVDAAQATVKLDIPPAVTVDPGAWWYKIDVTASGDTETAIYGWITVADT